MPDEIQQTHAPRHTLLRRAAALVLAIGMLTAAAIWATSTNESFSSDVGVTATGSSTASPSQMTPREEYEIEKIGGKSAVYVAKFDRWLSGLFHGKNLAGLIAALSLLISLGCWREAHWQRLQTTSNP